MHRWKCFAGALFVAYLAAVAVVPAAVLRVGSDISYIPFEFYPSGSKRPTGFDVGLLEAIVAAMGRTDTLVNRQFDDLLPAVARGRLDIAISAISDTRKREKQVDFIDYFIGGGGIVVPEGNPHRIFSLDALCGYSVTVESGTSYEADLNAQSAACKRLGLGSIRIASFRTDDEAFEAFTAGRSDAYVADYPVGEYRSHYANGGKALEVAGNPFDVIPYGIAVAKNNVALRTAVRDALLSVIADGRYDKLLKRWGLQRGALRSAPIDAGTLFEVK
jgi:polar amino acid transport system substrate-binding protein